MSHEKDQGHLGAGEDGMPRHGVARDAKQQVLELAEGVVILETNPCYFPSSKSLDKRLQVIYY